MLIYIASFSAVALVSLAGQVFCYVILGNFVNESVALRSLRSESRNRKRGVIVDVEND